MSNSRWLLLLGSGASRAAGMPTVDEITKLLTAANVYRYSDGSYHLGEAPSSLIAEETQERLGPVRRFLLRLREEVERYYKPGAHDANYEDLHFLASQVRDVITGEYENPAVLAFVEKLESDPNVLEPEPGATVKQHWTLQELAQETTDYIHDVVTSLPSRPGE